MSGDKCKCERPAIRELELVVPATCALCGGSVGTNKPIILPMLAMLEARGALADAIAWVEDLAPTKSRFARLSRYRSAHAALSAAMGDTASDPQVPECEKCGAAIGMGFRFCLACRPEGGPDVAPRASDPKKSARNDVETLKRWMGPDPKGGKRS